MKQDETMTWDEYLKWQVRVTNLDEKQAIDLLQRMRQLKKMPGNVLIAQEEVGDDWLMDGIVRALKAKGWVSSASMARLRNTKGFRLYLQDAAEVRKKLGSLIGGEGNIQIRTTLAYLVGHALIFWVERRKKIPNTAGSVMAHACHSLEAIEEQFPGYIAANLFHLVIGGSSAKNIRADQGGGRKRIARAPRG